MRSVLIALAVCFLASTTSAQVSYRFKDVKELHYRVVAQAQLPDSIDTYDGVISLGIRSTQANGQAEIAYAWLMPLRKDQNHGNALAPAPHGEPKFAALPATAQLVITGNGEMVRGREDEHANLPLMLGPCWQIMLPVLPDIGKKELTVERKLVLYSTKRTQVGPHRGPYTQYNEVRTERPAQERVTTRIVSTDGNKVTIYRKCEVETLEKVGDTPETKQTLEGLYLFNTTSGTMESFSARGSVDVVKPNITLKVPLAIEANLLAGEEVAKAKAAAETAAAAAKANAEMAGIQDREAAIKSRAGLPDGAVRTEMPCGKGGSWFTNADQSKRPMVGLNMQMMRWANTNDVINRIEPVWDPQTKPVKQSNRIIDVAKPGYAVSGLIINGDDYSHCVRIIYAKLDGQKLNLKDTYTTDWLGDPYKNERETQIGHSGHLVIGIYGKQGLNTDGIGLVILDPEGTYKPKPVAAIAEAPRRSNDNSPVPDGMQKSEMVGASVGRPYAMVDPGRKPVIGFRFKPGEWFGAKCFLSIEPLYEVPDPKTTPKDEVVVVAKDGYAVGAINVNAKERINAFSITFMKKSDTGLDPKTSYNSPLYGQMQGTERKVISGKGQFIYGIFGLRATNVDAIGIVTDAAPDQPAK